MPFGEGQSIEGAELKRLRELIAPAGKMPDIDQWPINVMTNVADRIDALDREVASRPADREDLLSVLGSSAEAKAIRAGMARR